jgi:hypothetical protein
MNSTNMMMPNMTNGQFSGHVNGMPVGGGSQSPQQYAAALQRNMQHQGVTGVQQRMGSGSPAMTNVQPVSRSATPATGQAQQMSAGMQIQRPGSVGMTAGLGDDGSPRMM